MLTTISRTLLFGALLAAPLAAQNARDFFIPDDTPNVGTCNSFPLGSTNPFSYQVLVLAEDLEPGRITTLAFAPCNSGVSTYVNLQIRMAHTTSATLSPTFATNLGAPAGGFDVLSRSTFDWARTADTWSDLALDRHFEYNGVDNLVIEIRHDAGINPSACHRTNNVGRLFSSGNSTATGGTVDMAALKMRIGMGEYAYSDSNDPTAGTCNVFPFGQTQMRYQQIIPASDLPNHPGTIRDISFSPCNTGTRTFTQLDITLAHSTVSTFSTANTFNSNIGSGATLCLTGPKTWNLTANEWNNVGLSSGFDWDGVSDVIVDVVAFSSGSSGAFHRDSTRPRCWNGSATAANPSGTGISALKIRLSVECQRATRSISPFAEGCGPHAGGPLGIGSGTPGILGAGFPELGGTHTLLMRFGPDSGLGAFVLGFNNGAPFPQPIPGAPGCFQRTDNIGVLITFFQPGGLSDAVLFSLTNNPVFCGVRYFVQGAAFWPAANPLGVVTSNVLTMRIGS